MSRKGWRSGSEAAAGMSLHRTAADKSAPKVTELPGNRANRRLAAKLNKQALKRKEAA